MATKRSRGGSEAALRAQLADYLDWENAHVGFDRAVEGIPVAMRGVVPEGLAHSLWQVVEHIRLAQADILDFCVNKNYQHDKAWPDDYWPAAPAPRSASGWPRSLAAIRRDRAAMQQLARNRRLDLFATIPHGSGQTYLRELLLVADHAAYHVAQLVDIRRALGIWAS